MIVSTYSFARSSRRPVNRALLSPGSRGLGRMVPNRPFTPQTQLELRRRGGLSTTSALRSISTLGPAAENRPSDRSGRGLSPGYGGAVDLGTLATLIRGPISTLLQVGHILGFDVGRTVTGADLRDVPGPYNREYDPSAGIGIGPGSPGGGISSGPGIGGG